MKPDKYVCIHGHFYQPPRENAWLEVVEMQDSAAPFHDWNDRINFECYAPNSAARILGNDERIGDIVNNYVNISFNFGPTLLSWLAAADPGAYHAILEADANAQRRFGGHGAAIAQVYNHIIMPLANYRDKETQVIWGIRDFEARFKRKPEGLWLAETAVDIETLEILAQNDIAFTILAPRQAKAVKAPGQAQWQMLDSSAVDCRRPYLCKLPSGKSIALFFYHGEVSQSVAFSGLLNDGKRFADALMGHFDPTSEPQLMHIATDGESYGHHHRFGEMALAACIRQLQERDDVQLTNYGDFLERFPPEWEAQIHENSSWSCVHGVERWRADCGCCSGGRPEWRQHWRKPLRELLDWLRDQLVPVFTRYSLDLLKNPWEARNDYISVILDRSPQNVDDFLAKHSRRKLENAETVTLLRLMEMQRNALLMFTSCGWFFDELSGLETDQILQYANRAIHYAEQISGTHLHNAFLHRLENIPSNVYKDGSVSYLQNVVAAKADLARVGMHYAVSSLFDEDPGKSPIFNYIAESEVFHRSEAGNQRLATGRTRVVSRITRSEKLFSFVALYLGQLNFFGHISVNMPEQEFDRIAGEITAAFERSDVARVIGLMEDYFGGERFNFWQLFRDEKRGILEKISGQSANLIDTAFREIYNDGYQFMTAIKINNIPLPEAYQSAALFVLNEDLRRCFAEGHLNLRELKRLYREFNKWGLEITRAPALQLSASERIFHEIQFISAFPENAPDLLHNLNQTLRLLESMGIEINYWKSQNLYFSLLSSGNYRSLPHETINLFLELGQLLGIAVPPELEKTD
jgi:alpha-amylase/alpha-mannosidase (GH57 family)